MITRLKKMADDGMFPHSMMMIEENGYGALPIALSLIQYLSCENHIDGDSCGHCHTCNSIQKLIHPDLHFVFPVNITSKSGSDKKPISNNFLPIWRKLVLEDPYFSEERLNAELGIEDKVGTISVAEASSILSTMNLRAFEGKNKYMIIYLPERMTTEAANKLLKIVEEPYPGTYFFFITHSFERVIKTISSRCLRIQLHPRGKVENNLEESPYFKVVSDIFENCLSKNLTELLKINETLAAYGRERQKEFCLYIEAFLRKTLMVQRGLYEIAYLSDYEKESIIALSQKLPENFFQKAYTAIETARSGIESNVNSKMVFCNMSNLFFVSLYSLSQ